MLFPRGLFWTSLKEEKFRFPWFCLPWSCFHWDDVWLMPSGSWERIFSHYIPQNGSFNIMQCPRLGTASSSIIISTEGATLIILGNKAPLAELSTQAWEQERILCVCIFLKKPPPCIILGKTESEFNGVPCKVNLEKESTLGLERIKYQHLVRERLVCVGEWGVIWCLRNKKQ